MTDYDTNWYDRDGTVITAAKAAKLMFDETYWELRRDVLDGYTVNTVWLGRNDHGTADNPLIFETIVRDTTGRQTQDCEEYGTEGAALVGHDRIVTRLRYGGEG